MCRQTEVGEEVLWKGDTEAALLVGRLWKGA
jgi:hypothetical protein